MREALRQGASAVELEGGRVGSEVLEVEQRSSIVREFKQRALGPGGEIGAGIEDESLVELAGKEKEVLARRPGVVGDVDGGGRGHNLAAKDDAFGAHGDKLALVVGQAVKRFGRESGKADPVGQVRAAEHGALVAGDEPGARQVVHRVEPVGGAAGTRHPVGGVIAGQNRPVIAHGHQGAIEPGHLGEPIGGDLGESPVLAIGAREDGALVPDNHPAAGEERYAGEKGRGRRGRPGPGRGVAARENRAAVPAEEELGSIEKHPFEVVGGRRRPEGPEIGVGRRQKGSLGADGQLEIGAAAHAQED